MAENPEQGGSTAASPPPTGPGWESPRREVARPTPSPAPPALPSPGTKRNCPHCGSAVPPQAGVCPTCGESLKERPRRVRCRQCGKQASSQLVLCPHCGRELRPAPSRLLTWGIPALLLLFGLLLLTVDTGLGSPLGWAGARVNAVVVWIGAMGERLDPQIEIIPAAGSEGAPAAVPAGGEPAVEVAGGASSAAPAAPTLIAAAPVGTGTPDDAAGAVVAVTPPADIPAPTATPSPLQTAAPTDTPTATPTATPLPTDTPTAIPTDTPTDTPTAVPTDTPTRVPTDTPVDTPTRSPAVSPTSASAAPPAAATATMRATAQAAATAGAATRATDALLGRAGTTAGGAAAGASATATATPEPPTATSAPLLPTPTPTPLPPPPTPTPVIYVVKAGDTVLAIALRYGVSQEDLLAANGMNAADVRFIQLGQQLVIPLGLPAASAASAASAPAATTYTVRAGDTLVAIAGRLRIPVDALIAANGFTAEQVRLLRPGQEIIVPAPTPLPAATAAAVVAAPTAPPVPASSYTIRPGDTLLAISRRVGVSVEAILAANNMTLADAPNLRPDQVLVIPGAAQPGAAAPTATPVSVAPAAQATPTAAPAAIRLDAPQLRSFENGASVSCAGSGELTWLAVPYMTDTDRYRLHLGFVSGVDAAGNVQVTWLIEQDQPSTNTAWQMDAGLCRFAPQELGRQWRWYVEVVDAKGAPASLPSAIWGFSWN